MHCHTAHLLISPYLLSAGVPGLAYCRMTSVLTESLPLHLTKPLGSFCLIARNSAWLFLTVGGFSLMKQQLEN